MNLIVELVDTKMADELAQIGFRGCMCGYENGKMIFVNLYADKDHCRFCLMDCESGEIIPVGKGEWEEGYYCDAQSIFVLLN